MGYTSPDCYTLRIQAGSTAPADSTTYYCSQFSNNALTTTQGLQRLYVPRTGTIRVVNLVWLNTNDVTEEDTTISILVNGTSNTVFYTGTVGATNGFNYINNTTLSIPVVVGDYIEIKIICPAWVTNPTAMYLNGHLTIYTG